MTDAILTQRNKYNKILESFVVGAPSWVGPHSGLCAEGVYVSIRCMIVRIKKYHNINILEDFSRLNKIYQRCSAHTKLSCDCSFGNTIFELLSDSLLAPVKLTLAQASFGSA